jgi:acyl-coenzyme A thioesterase PaaI-like protein
LADTAFAVAGNSYGRTTVAAGATIMFVESTSLGDALVAEAERVRRGRSGLRRDGALRRISGGRVPR